MNIYVPGTGNPHAKIVLLGEAPSFEEEVNKKPFVGPSGRFLDRMLEQVGINRNDCWVTNVSKYAVPPNPKKGKKIPFLNRAKSVGVDMEQQLHELKIELASIKPNIVIPLGGTALWGLTGKSPINKWRGSIIHGMGYKAVATYHPAHILHQDGEVSGYWNKQIMKLDLIRARDESHTKELNLPSRVLHVIENSAQLYDFIQRYRNETYPAIDIEAHSCIPICVGISFNPNHGITVPLWNTHGISRIGNADMVNIWSLLAGFLANHEVVGQNFGYDRDKLKRLGFVVKGLYSDTMYKAFCINPEWPKNLAFNTSIFTREPYYKDEGMYEGAIEDLLIGCARDACTTKEVDLAQQKVVDELGLDQYYRNFLVPLHNLYAGIEQEGLRTSDDNQRAIIKKYIEWSEDLSFKIYQLVGRPINTGSWQQVRKLLFDEWKLPHKETTGEDDLTKLLNDPKIKDVRYRKTIEYILEKRRVNKTIDTYAYGAVDFDGRMRTSYFICLKTGRSSTAQQEPPIRPIIHYKDFDGKNKTQAYGMAFQTITKHGDIGSDIRTSFIPDEGEVFLGVDSAQAEARIIFLLAEDYKALKDIDTCDYHALTASWFFGGTELTHSKKVLGYESPLRFAGKTLRHACHLGAGAKRAAATVNTDARKAKIEYEITVAKAKHCIEIFHAMQPSIKGVFQKEIIDRMKSDRILIAPVPYGIDAKVGGRRLFWEREGDELYREAFSYIPQRTVSENTKGAALRIKKSEPWIKILVEAHDGLLVSVPVARKLEAARILKREMEVPIDFSTCNIKRGIITIPAEVEFGYDYKNLEPLKGL